MDACVFECESRIIMITLLSLLCGSTRNQKIYHQHHQKSTTFSKVLMHITSTTDTNSCVSYPKTFFDGLRCLLFIRDRFVIVYIHHVNHNDYNVEKVRNFWFLGLDCCCSTDAYDNYINSTLSYWIKIDHIRANITILYIFNHDQVVYS